MAKRLFKNSPDVNSSLGFFSDDFKTLFDLNFPFKTTLFNKNIHRISNFMTTWLLISRDNKIRLHKISYQTLITTTSQPIKSIAIDITRCLALAGPRPASPAQTFFCQHQSISQTPRKG
jgi:hypothetical protein